MSKSRQPAGIPIGGQFAAASRSRAHLTLVPDLPLEHLEAEEAHSQDPVTDASPEPTQPRGVKVTTDGQYTTVTGSKYTGYRPASEVARDVRADIKTAIGNGTLPRDYRYSVTSDSGAVRITVKGMSFDEIHGLLRPDGLRNRRYTSSTRELVVRLEAIGRAYDKSTSDPMTDYHHGNHYTFVSIEDPASAAWERSDRARVALQRTKREVAAALAPYATKAGVSISDLAKADVSTDPRLATTLTTEEHFAVIVEQEKLRTATDARTQAEQQHRMLRDGERWADDDLYLG